MPIKLNVDLDGALEVLHEPIYDEEKLHLYCKQHQKTIEQLSEEEKQQFVVGCVDFHLDMHKE